MTGYFERRREEARETLQKLRNYYSRENSPDPEYDYVRRCVNFKITDINGKENPVKSLRRIRKTIVHRTEKYLPEVLKEIEDYENSTEEEKEKRRSFLLRQARTKRFASDLETWINKAELVLSDIIKTNSNEMDGFEYYYKHSPGGSFFADSDLFKKISVSGGEIYTNEIARGYGQESVYPPIREDSLSISQSLLRYIHPSRAPGYKFIPIQGDYTKTASEFKKLNLYEGLIELNHKRNELVRTIEKLTGRNLKKEIREVKNGRN
jgi:hypothetical protein